MTFNLQRTYRWQRQAEGPHLPGLQRSDALWCELDASPAVHDFDTWRVLHRKQESHRRALATACKSGPLCPLTNWQGRADIGARKHDVVVAAEMPVKNRAHCTR